jgi:hypothetical protein
VGSAASVFWNISNSTYTQFHIKADFILINIFNLSEVLSRWFLPGILPLVLRMVFLLFVLGMAATGLFTLAEGKDHRPGLMITLINVFYFFILCCFGKLDVWEMERYLSVIYPFFIITLVYSLYNLKNIFQRKKLFYLIPFFLILWGVYSVSRTIKNSSQWHQRSRMEVIPENCQKIKKDF